MRISRINATDDDALAPWGPLRHGRRARHLFCLRWTDRRGPMASGRVQKIEVLCNAFSFSVIRAGDGIASDDHPAHSSTNDTEWRMVIVGSTKKAFMPAGQGRRSRPAAAWDDGAPHPSRHPRYR